VPHNFHPVYMGPSLIAQLSVQNGCYVEIMLITPYCNLGGKWLSVPSSYTGRVAWICYEFVANTPADNLVCKFLTIPAENLVLWPHIFIINTSYIAMYVAIAQATTK